MTTDTALSQSDLVQIGESLRGVPDGDYQFIQASNVLYPPNPNWVEFEQPQADALFSAVAHDTTLPRLARPRQRASAGGATPAPSSAGSPASPAPPASSPAGQAAPAPRSSRSPVSNLAQSYGGITGSASCTSDSAAFAGPLSPAG